MADSIEDVLIVGAGPTGLFLAADLLRHGVTPRVIDMREQASIHSKALAIHARTLEIFADLGLVDRFLEVGRRLDSMELRSGAHRLARFDFHELDSPFPFILVVPQTETERILAEFVVERGGSVERGTTLRSLVLRDNHVSARIERPSGASERLDARWVVGCDGAGSTVRTQLGLKRSGEDLEGAFLLADVSLSELDPDRGRAWFGEGGVTLCIPLPEPGRYRVVGTVDEREDDSTTPELADVQGVLERCLLDDEGKVPRASAPEWLARFRVRQRKVSRYRVGRAILAGDAAHSHSPVGGQGMNTGLQDAYNLGWKLAAVVRGRADISLLDTYQAEREPVADTLLRDTARATRAVTLRSPVARQVRNHLARFLGSLEVVQQRMARTLGETAIHYRQSALSLEARASLRTASLTHDSGTETPSVGEWREFGSAPHAGDRAPDAWFGAEGSKRRLHEVIEGPRYVLFLFDGRADTAAGYENLRDIAETVARSHDHVRTFAVVPRDEKPAALEGVDVLLDPDLELHDRYGASSECAYLIRPDGYVGCRTQPADGDTLVGYLAEYAPAPGG